MGRAAPWQDTSSSGSLWVRGRPPVVLSPQQIPTSGSAAAESPACIWSVAFPGDSHAFELNSDVSSLAAQHGIVLIVPITCNSPLIPHGHPPTHLPTHPLQALVVRSERRHPPEAILQLHARIPVATISCTQAGVCVVLLDPSANRRAGEPRGASPHSPNCPTPRGVRHGHAALAFSSTDANTWCCSDRTYRVDRPTDTRAGRMPTRRPSRAPSLAAPRRGLSKGSSRAVYY